MANGQGKKEELPPKERLESLKLEAEIYQLKKPIYNKVGFYVIIAPVFLSIIGFIYSYSTGYLGKLHDANLQELESKRTLLNAENVYLDMKRDLLEQQIRLFEPEKEKLAKEKALLVEKNAKLDEEYKKKNQRLDEEYEKRLLALDEKLKNKEKAQDKYANLRIYLKGQRLDLKMPLPKETLGKTPEETTKKLQQYLNTLTQIKTEDKYSFDDWYYKGVTEFDTGKYEKAIASFKRALEKEPGDASAAYTYNYIGASYVGLGNDTEALKYLTESIRLKPDNPLPFLNRGDVYRRSGQKNEGDKDLNTARGLIESGEIKPETKAFYNKLLKMLENNLRIN
jgi:tetratricopeptide (TPR) repeat protein